MSNDIVGSAIMLASRSHRGQHRKYPNEIGLVEPYILHPARVAGMVTHGWQFFQVDDPTFYHIIAAAWLHDVIEDTATDFDTIVNTTSYATASLVEQLTNPSKAFPHLKREERKKMDREHCAEMSREAKLIKMFDRIDNVTGMVKAPRDFALLYLEESEALAETLRPASRDLFNVLAATINAARKRLTTPVDVLG